MKKVLFTRKLNLPEIIQCFLHDIFPVIKPMIKIVPIALHQKNINTIISGQYPYFVFTSKNAVKFFMKDYHKRMVGTSFNDVEFIVIGRKTGMGLKSMSNKIHVFDYAGGQSFSDYVSGTTNGKPYLYFCSDLASIKWKGQAKHNNITIIENYRTTFANAKVSMRTINNVVFMSSSSVTSFYENNVLDENVTCFVIGEPTRKTLMNYFDGEIIKPKQLNFFSLINIIQVY